MNDFESEGPTLMEVAVALALIIVMVLALYSRAC